MDFNLFIDSVQSAEHHMRVDQEIIEGSRCVEEPLLRFYSWDRGGSITLGRFLLPHELIISSYCEEHAICYAMRPTGGGLLCHSTSDLSFSLFIPRSTGPIFQSPQENYIKIQAQIYQALSKVTENRLEHIPYYGKELPPVARPIYCMASCTAYDIVMNGRKIGGSACRITKKGLLFQASLFLYRCNWSYFLPALCNGVVATEEMKKTSTSIEEVLQSSLPSKACLREEIYRALQLYVS